jgi:hypothetical protein
MHEPLDALEVRISQLRRAMRTAKAAGESSAYDTLRAELQRTEAAWEVLVEPADPACAPPPFPRRGAAPALLPAREQVHRTLMLLGVPAAPKLIVGAHDAFFPGDLPAAKLTSLRRDEERSYRGAPNARPYYLCPALTYDLLAPARALLTVSTWPLERRVVGPLSPRMDYLTCAINIAQAAADLSASGESTHAHPVARLLWRFAANIPGAVARNPDSSYGGPAAVRPEVVLAAARAEARLHADADRAARAESAARARSQLSDARQLFGARSGAVRVHTADA